MDKLKVGDTFYLWDDGYKYHVVKIFTDNNSELLVCKYFGKHKQFWHYEIYRMRYVWDGIKAAKEIKNRSLK